MTLAESRLWDRLRRGAIGASIRRQHPIGPFVADFYCHAARLVIEVDGPVHDTTVERDARRHALMIAHDLEVIRFANDQVLTETDAVLDVLARVIERRTTEVRSASTSQPPKPPSGPPAAEHNLLRRRCATGYEAGEGSAARHR